MRLEQIDTRLSQWDRGHSLTRGVHFEHSALYAAYFATSALHRLRDSHSSTLLSVYDQRRGRTATSFAPLGNSIATLLASHSTFPARFGFELTRVKHVPEPQAAEVEIALGSGWTRLPSVSAKFEFEDAWPQVEWRLADIAAEPTLSIAEAFEGPAFGDIREQCRRFINKNGTPVAVPYDARAHVGVATQLVTQTEEDRAAARDLHGRAREGHSKEFNQIISFLKQLGGDKLSYTGELLLVGGHPAGLWIGGALARKAMALYVFLADRHLRAASQYCLAQAMVSARRMGYQTLCLGGSETNGLFQFKTWHMGKAFRAHGALRNVVEFEKS